MIHACLFCCFWICFFSNRDPGVRPSPRAAAGHQALVGQALSTRLTCDRCAKPSAARISWPLQPGCSATSAERAAPASAAPSPAPPCRRPACRRTTPRRGRRGRGAPAATAPPRRGRGAHAGRARPATARGRRARRPPRRPAAASAGRWSPTRRRARSHASRAPDRPAPARRRDRPLQPRARSAADRGTGCRASVSNSSRNPSNGTAASRSSRSRSTPSMAAMTSLGAIAPSAGRPADSAATSGASSIAPARRDVRRHARQLDQAEHRPGVVAVHDRQVGAERGVHPGRPLLLGPEGGDDPRHRVARRRVEGPEDRVLLAGEVLVEGARGDASAPADPLGRRRRRSRSLATAWAVASRMRARCRKCVASLGRLPRPAGSAARSRPPDTDVSRHADRMLAVGASLNV